MKKGTKKYITVKLVKSPYGIIEKHKESLKGLGLTRMNKVVKVEDNPCVRGMINKVIHMVEVEL
jgi:large subunit ribosomal protein L30